MFDGDEYFKGKAQAEISSLGEAIKDLKRDISHKFDGLDKKVDELRIWRARVYGVSMAISTLASAVVSVVAEFLMR